VVLRLPEPTLARSDAIASGRGWIFEPKLDGFRCLVCTHATFHVRSRRGWDMTHLLPELRGCLPAGVQLDGELVALDETGRPDFHRLSARMLHGPPARFFVFTHCRLPAGTGRARVSRRRPQACVRSHTAANSASPSSNVATRRTYLGSRKNVRALADAGWLVRSLRFRSARSGDERLSAYERKDHCVRT
jgi:hypothetical protein